MKRIRKIVIISVVSLLGLCILLAAASAISNLSLPQHSAITQTLSEQDKIRLSETLHLRQALGDTVWPSFAQYDIPIITYNEEYAFLVGYPNPPDGWTKVPQGIKRGTAWELTPGDTFDGQPYYRQILSDPQITPEAFTVRVGDRWVSSLQTLEWATISLANPIREDLPAFVRPFFPYRLFIGQLLGSSEKYISLLEHETFHSYQGALAPEKFAAAEQINEEENQYPWENQALRDDWQKELDLLAGALRSADQARTLELASQFLAIRASRRNSANLSSTLIAYEQQREWLEGLARYIELEIWRQASMDSYMPLPETSGLTDFEHYATFEKRWSQEINQISLMADDQGDGRFYYTGMAQAFLLDRLSPDWKQNAFDPGVWLEDMLSAAVTQKE